MNTLSVSVSGEKEGLVADKVVVDCAECVVTVQKRDMEMMYCWLIEL